MKPRNKGLFSSTESDNEENEQLSSSSTLVAKAHSAAQKTSMIYQYTTFPVPDTDSETEKAPVPDYKEPEMSLEELRQFANPESLRRLVVANPKYHIIRSLLAHGLITQAMLDPQPREASVVAYLLQGKQVPLVGALLDKQLVSSLQLADTSRGCNAVVMTAYLRDWALLRRFMLDSLIPLAAFFKCSEEPQVDSALKIIMQYADTDTRKDVNKYIYKALGPAIKLQDRPAVEKWLERFIGSMLLAEVMPALDYLLQTLPANQTTFSGKMNKLMDYLKLAEGADQSSKQNAVTRLVRTEMQLTSDVTHLATIKDWFNSQVNKDRIKPLFIVKRMLRSDETTAWENLLSEVNQTGKLKIQAEAQSATSNAGLSLLNQ